MITNIYTIHAVYKSWDSLDNETVGVQFPAGGRFFFLRLLAPFSLYPVGTGSSVPGGKAIKGVNLTTLLHEGLISRILELYLHSSYIFTA
jgi:hypothetical protein